MDQTDLDPVCQVCISIFEDSLEEENGRLPQTEKEVVLDTLAQRWWKVKEVMVGDPANRVALSADYQKLVLKAAWKGNGWIFINHLVMKGYPFWPDTLDTAVAAALYNEDLTFVESIVLNKYFQYMFNERTLMDVLEAFCKDYRWMSRAADVIALLPPCMFEKTIILYHKHVKPCRKSSQELKKSILETIKTHFRVPIVFMP